MCGIFGRYSASSPTGNLAQLKIATHSLVHRGPDGGAYWHEGPIFLGHRRLSIIDLIDGEQPLVSHDGRYVIIFNGEIYNYIELRDELRAKGAVFQTSSDTEVILEAYRNWGTDAFARLNGMFAFGIFDRTSKSLVLVRDRFGEKPMFYWEDPKTGVTFGSELKALFKLDDVPRDIDISSLCKYLTLNYVPGTTTLINNIKKLEPGSWRLYNAEGLMNTGYYWRTEDAVRQVQVPSNIHDAIEALQNRLDQAVRISLRSDVPVTLLLSGGIDSSLIAESAVRQGKIQTAYCLDFEATGFSEWENAKFVADKLGIEMRRAVAKVPDYDDFSDIVHHADDPLADSSSVAVWWLGKEVARDFKVAITGDGGDEIFAGYLTYQASKLYQILYQIFPGWILQTGRGVGRLLPSSDGKVTTTYKMQRFLRACGLPPSQAHLTWNGSWLPDDALNLISPDASQELHDDDILLSIAAGRYSGAVSGLLGHQIGDANDYLPNDILSKVDRMTMAHGLETRAPFLMPGVADFGLSLPDRLKLGMTGTSKRILRHIVQEKFGSKIGQAKKQGFSIPVHQWLRTEMRDVLEQLLCSETLAAIPFLDEKAVLRAKNRHLSGNEQLGYELWGIMTLVEWFRGAGQSKSHATSEPDLREIVI